MSIPFVREFAFEYGKVHALSPLVQRVVAENPGPFTYTGTGVYIIGTDRVAVIDPGPDLPSHREALNAALDGRTVSHVLVTHHHLDHTPLAHPLAKQHGCKVWGISPGGQIPDGGEVRMEAGDDHGFRADIELEDGQRIEGKDWTVTALHTPGHTSTHVCFALEEENVLFSGDHIMGWSTSVVSPPDGSMGDYIAQLKRIAAMKFKTIIPTHGPEITDPEPFVEAYIKHRETREAQIIAELKAGRTTIIDMVKSMYCDVDERLHPAAAHSVLAHMVHLVEQGRVTTPGKAELNSVYSLSA